ncbi:acyltransferase [Candidatus Woesebacteria bacterium]|nr:MAG: acyltransferase [Candidatus Woesebacteria bacterium]
MKNVLINENITFKDLLFKYTVRDFVLGTLSITPSSVGIVLRMLAYKIFLKKCGRGLIIKSLVTIKFPERIAIGNHVGIGEYSILHGDGGISIGNYTRIADHVSIVSFRHEFRKRNTIIKLQEKIKEGVYIGSDCWIGSGVKILSGVKIGNGSVVGASSVVTKDIPPYTVSVGIPARAIKKR